MKLLFASSEGAPFIKTGGLGDVAYALPRALSEREDMEVTVVLPYYAAVKNKFADELKFVCNFGVPRLVSGKKPHVSNGTVGGSGTGGEGGVGDCVCIPVP